MSAKQKHIMMAVLGATGELGRVMLQALDDAGVPVAHVRALASQKSLGSVVGYGEGHDDLAVLDAASFDYSTVDVVISALAPATAQQLLPSIARAGVKVIDMSPAFRMDPDVPLVVAGVNNDALAGARKNMVACPDALCTMLASALAPLHEAAQIERVVVATYQSTASAGRAAMDELFSQTRAVYVNDPLVKEQFTKQIAFNVIPQVGSFRDDGTTEGEFRLTAELKRVLDNKIKLVNTQVRVAAFVGSALAVNVQCHNDLDAAAARTLFRRHGNITVVDHKHEEGLVTLVEAAAEQGLYISRVRDDTTVENGISFWLVADETRAALAKNAVDLALLWVGAAHATRH